MDSAAAAGWTAVLSLLSRLAPDAHLPWYANPSVSRAPIHVVGIMSLLFTILLGVFYSQVVNTTRQYLGTEGTLIDIPHSPRFATISGNASTTISWLRWERWERYMYTWSQGPVVRLCNATSNSIPVLQLLLAVGSTPNNSLVLPMWRLENNCTAFPVHINCDSASLFLGVNTTTPFSEEIPWELKVSYVLVNTECKGGLGAATFYAVASILLVLIISFSVLLCAGIYRYCTKQKSREYELVATTDMIEIREY